MLNDPNVSRRHAELRRGSTGDWQIVDLESTNGVKVNDRRRRLQAVARRPRHARDDPVHLRHRALAPLDTEPIAVALKFGFLAVLYLFLFWVSRSALRELRRTTAPAPEATGLHPVGPGGRAAATDAFLVAVRGGGLPPGERYDLFGGLSIGRSSDADVRIEDRFASAIHARLYSRGASYYVEDMSSTNGTFLNGGQLAGEAELSDLDEIKIGDTSSASSSRSPGSTSGLMLKVADHAFRTDTGRQRNANEDSYYVHGRVFAVADGMGGAQAGEVASRIAADSFESAVRSGERASRTCARSPRPRTSASTASPRTTRAIRGWGRR